MLVEYGLYRAVYLLSVFLNLTVHFWLQSRALYWAMLPGFEFLLLLLDSEVNLAGAEHL